MSTTNTREEVKNVYTQVTNSADQILNELKAVNAQNDEKLREKVGVFIDDLEKQKEHFKDLVDELERNSEFDKFSIAFFGQTGAGKSTIIESLRILFDEESRRKQMEQNGADMASIEKDFQKRCDTLVRDLNNIKAGCKRSVMSYVIPVVTLVAGFAAGFVVGGM